MLNKLLRIIVIAFTLFSFNFSAMSDDAIKIAMIEPMSGPLAAIGLDLIEQMEFFAEKVNKEGGVLGGRHIEIVPFDNQMIAEKTIQQLRKVIDQDIRYVTQGV